MEGGRETEKERETERERERERERMCFLDRANRYMRERMWFLEYGYLRKH